MTGLTPGWSMIDGAATAWFETSSLVDSVALGRRVVERVPASSIDVRHSGLQVRLNPDEDVAAVAGGILELGSVASEAAPPRIGLVIESPHPEAVSGFWHSALGYVPGERGALSDPLQRDPALQIRASSEHRPLRNRMHVDVARPSAVVEQVSPGEPGGPYGLRHSDADGNEVDLVPGEPYGDGPGTDGWQAVFSVMACYRIGSTAQQVAVADTAATIATEVGFPLVIDLRPGLVILDSGKDQADAEAHGLNVDVASMARRIQRAAQDLGAATDPMLPRFVQFVLDAADVAAVRAFWCAVFGYVPDRRNDVTDIVDPRRLNPVLVFQDLEADEERRSQRNRLHLELTVPPGQGRTRLDAALGAGGRLLEEAPGLWALADPEGNELVIIDGT